MTVVTEVVHEPRCGVCRLALERPDIGLLVRELFVEGHSPHAIARRLRRMLGAEAPSRSATYRCLVGDLDHAPHSAPQDRELHRRARLRSGTADLRGAPLLSVEGSRSRIRGSGAFVRQVADYLVERGLLNPVLRQAGYQEPEQQEYADQYESPEEQSLRANWPRGYGRP